ncbi:MAG: GNAT family N-acetyltransferase [Halobacteriales archaeon]
MDVREATPDDLPPAATVLDAAMLATDDLPAAVRAGRVLVAVEEGRVLGALVVAAPASVPDWSHERDADAHVEAVAVRRRRRGQGVGTVLVEAALSRGDRLTAAFDPVVAPFYESLGFAIERTGDRWRGWYGPE